MGRLLIALVLALACGLLPARPAQAALVAEYRFEETSYAQVVGEVSDWSGNGRHARTVGTASASTSSGYTCRGVNLPYNSGSTITAVDTGFDLSSVVGATGSISFWYYSDNTEYSDRTILDATTANNARFLLFREDNSHSPTYIDVDLGFVVTSASGAEHSLDESNVMSDGRWWHIAVTWRLVTGGGAARIQLYVDGSRVADRSFSISTAGLASGISSLYLGDSRGTSYSPSRSAGGRFDTVRIYNHELSSTEVNADKNATPSCTQLHHLELTHASATGASGETQTFTIKACANASCSSLYTGGVTGTLTGSGSGMSVSFPSGSGFTIGSGSSSTTVQAIISPSGTVTMGLSGASPTPSNWPPVFCGMGVAAASGNSCNFTTVNALHHMRLTAASNNGVTCDPTSFTIQACSNADCSSPYTGGMSGSLNVSGGGVTVTYPSGNGFVIGSGSSSTPVSAHLVTAGTATVGLSGLSLSPSSSPAVWCGLGSSPSAGGSCAYTADTAGLLLEVPDHRAEVARGFSVRAVKTADDSLACTPAFASVSKAIRFTCAYSNPGSGTRAVRINGSALNDSNNPAAACDGTGRSVTLAFDTSGTASATLQYADVGEMTLAASYTGAGADAALVMSGNDGFVAAPYRFGFSGLPAGSLSAGSPFSATVTALNAADVATPNFGRESPPHGATLGFVRTQPQGGGASNGAFIGTLGGFSGGSATGSNLAWSEVGRGDVSTTLTGGNYLGSGQTLAGHSLGAAVACATEGGSCALPSGAMATVYYGASGRIAVQHGLSGSVPCTNSTFGDPFVGTAKSCSYVLTSGSSGASSGTLGPFHPHHFDVQVTPACGGFSYAGQPVAVSVTARQAGGAQTLNYDGSGALSPVFAKGLTLSDNPALGTGSLSGATLSASAFLAGSASASVAYTHTNKLTGSQVLTLRATDSDGVSSSGHLEGSTELRSGRLRMANRFGRADAPLSLPVRAEYWGGSAWVPSADDGCTALPATSVVIGNRLTAQGGASTATTAASAVTLINGAGMLTLTAPSPAGQSLSLELALNLGNSGGQQSCRIGLGAGTPAGLPWLRSHNGACAASADRDPSARASFGVFAPETGKRVYTRDLH